MTTLTLSTVLVVLLGLAFARHYGRALALGAATPAGAAVAVGAVIVPTFYAVAVGAALLVLVDLLQRSRRRQRLRDASAPGLLPLVLLLGWAFTVTLAAPVLFDGLTVYAAGGVEQELSAGLLTVSNLAQLVYLVLSVCVVILLSRSNGAGPEVVGLATGAATLLSFWSYLSINAGLPYPVGLFDNSPNFAYVEGYPGGAPRFRGIFSEPAGLATSCLVSIAYTWSRVLHSRGLRRIGAGLVLAVAVFLGSVSTSTTFVVAIAVLVMLAGVSWGLQVASARKVVSLAAVAGACGTGLVALWLAPAAIARFTEEVSSKVGSSSYRERSGADSQSYHLLLDTLGMGVGLGSNRPSSFAAGLLSTVGLIGTACFVASVVVVIMRAYPLPAFRPVVWALVAALISKLISGPDLNDTSGLLWLAIGVLARGGVINRRVVSAAQARQPDEPVEDEPASTTDPPAKAGDRRPMARAGAH